ncbi:helix-turn-helix transcriptional regulator [Aquitalea magnusonii]|uniref:helix-turn-helix transcriptional regulator n=2 Tax=Aquitalea magnusonii TaxID=332411 RepID=UPI001875ACEE|nr:helix-turn-helix transcriptional regulator [Aquitalea magnusonii]
MYTDGMRQHSDAPMAHYAAMKMGDRIRQERESRSWTQEQLARKAGIARSTLSMIESGEADTTTDVFFRFVRAFKVSAEWLKTGAGDRYPPPGGGGYLPSVGGLEELADRLLAKGPDEIGRLMAIIAAKAAK